MTVMMLCACSSLTSRLLNTPNQLELRALQERSFDGNDMNAMMRNIIATLQDLDFIIERADAELGTITALKTSEVNTRLTISVRKQNNNQLLVRTSAQYGNDQVTVAKFYQDFYAALHKAIFVDIHAVE